MPLPDDPARRRAWPVVLGLVVAALVTGLVAAVVVVGTRSPSRVADAPPGGSTVGPTSGAAPGRSGSSSPRPTAAPPTPLPRTSGSPTVPSEPKAPKGPDQSLRGNALYAVDLHRARVSCDLAVRRPRPALPDKKLAPYLRQVVGCLTAAFTRPLADRGFVLREPKIRTYHRSLKTPCGTFGQDGSPAYYCAATRTIYWPDTVDNGNEAYTFARLGYVGLTAHEFGHHLQASTGMLDAYARAYTKASTSGRYALSRRLELQAQCFEGVFLTVARSSTEVSRSDRQELRAWHGYTGDEDPPKSRLPDHGTSRAQYRWLERGLDSADFGRCNTWKASKRDVK